MALTGVDVTALPPSFRDGVDLFMQKPFPVSQLIAALHKLVGNEAPSVATVSQRSDMSDAAPFAPCDLTELKLWKQCAQLARCRPGG